MKTVFFVLSLVSYCGYFVSLIIYKESSNDLLAWIYNTLLILGCVFMLCYLYCPTKSQKKKNDDTTRDDSVG